MIPRDEILTLIPHQDAMCLWDEVMSWDTTRVRIRAANHRDPAHPLRSDGQLRAVHLCEYGAQAMAVHGGLLARESGGVVRSGMLVSLRGITLHVSRIDDLAGDLECEAQPLAGDAHSQQYVFRISHAGTVVAEGRAAVMYSPS